jgi:hypothetical protein
MFPAFPTPPVNTLLPKPPKNPENVTLSRALIVIFRAFPTPSVLLDIEAPLVTKSDPVVT